MEFSKVPLGFGMALARDFTAMNAYSALTENQKQAVLFRANNAQSEKEMQQIVNDLAADRIR